MSIEWDSLILGGNKNNNNDTNSNEYSIHFW